VCKQKPEEVQLKRLSKEVANFRSDGSGILPKRYRGLNPLPQKPNFISAQGDTERQSLLLYDLDKGSQAKNPYPLSSCPLKYSFYSNVSRDKP
jgi:hypothetical protein